ncbi:MAG: hypothetical protein HY286_02090 [Planctomycetes bacterium]|nr:hypothetical protein [Planctomycetota bacterium]
MTNATLNVPPRTSAFSSIWTDDAPKAINSETSSQNLTPVWKESIRFRRATIRITNEGMKPQWIQPVFAQVEKLAQLEANWDSYGALPLSEKAAMLAIRLLANVLSRDSIPPAVIPTNLGGLQLEWHRVGCDFEIKLSPDGKTGYFFEDSRNGIIKESEDVRDLDLLRTFVKQVS